MYALNFFLRKSIRLLFFDDGNIGNQERIVAYETSISPSLMGQATFKCAHTTVMMPPFLCYVNSSVPRFDLFAD